MDTKREWCRKCQEYVDAVDTGDGLTYECPWCGRTTIERTDHTETVPVRKHPAPRRPRPVDTLVNVRVSFRYED